MQKPLYINTNQHATGQNFSCTPSRPGLGDTLTALGQRDRTLPLATVPADNLGVTRENADVKFRRLMTLTEASMKDKSAVISQYRELCSFYHDDTSHLQVASPPSPRLSHRYHRALVGPGPVPQTQLQNMQKRLEASEAARQQMEENLAASQGTIREFEGLTYCPSSDGAAAIEESIRAIEADIRRFALNDDIPPAAMAATPTSTTAPATPLGEAPRPPSKGQQLVETKFRRLEDLIFVLKRRLNVFEQNASLAEAVARSGGVEGLLAENNRLRKDSERLHQMEARYDASALLGRSKLDTYDPPALRALVRALQNELGSANLPHSRPQPQPQAARELVERFNLEQNPALRLTCAAAAPDRKMAPLPPLPDPELRPPPSFTRSISSGYDGPMQAAAGGLGDDADQVELEDPAAKGRASLRGAPAGGAPASGPAGGLAMPTEGSAHATEEPPSARGGPPSSGLVGRVAALEAENERLRDSAGRLEAQCEATRRLADIDQQLAAILDGRERPAGGKSRKLVELEALNGQLLDQIRGGTEDAAKRDQELRLVQSALAEQTQLRAQAQEQAAQLTQQMIAQTAAMADLTGQARAQKQSFDGLSLLSVALAERVFDVDAAGLPERPEPNAFVAEAVQAYARVQRSATVIQSAYRGYQVRGRLGAGGPMGSAGPMPPGAAPQSSALRASQQGPLPRATQAAPQQLRQSQQQQPSAAPATTAGKAALDPEVAKGRALAIQSLVGVLTRIGAASGGLRHYPKLLAGTRAELVGTVRTGVAASVGEFGATMARTCGRITEAMQAILMHPRADKCLQTEREGLEQRGAQTEEPRPEEEAPEEQAPAPAPGGKGPAKPAAPKKR
ncbi:hypothetical protein PAPYR_1854 [Paratrimastix pyriformis]|uniref:Uncharacterized protein n=1 Tax=Paratrimastix pyriformis TaxID=342808 RepID=A0ABQ8UT70_9EUKA|nr:hypothetical protein PAPYR_1854 [Paratrimastix pyriformis]